MSTPHNKGVVDKLMEELLSQPGSNIDKATIMCEFNAHFEHKVSHFKIDW